MSEILWGLIYIFSFIVMLLGGLLLEHFFREKGSMLSCIVCFGTLFLIAALKNVNVGRDTGAYLNAYESLGSSDWSVIKHKGFEIGFSVFMKVFAKTGCPFYLFSAVNFFVVFFLFGFTTYKLSKSPAMSSFLFGTIIYAFGLSAMRQILAASILAFAFLFLNSKRIKSIIVFIALSIIAMFFHTSSVVAIPLFLIVLIPVNAKNTLFSCFLSIIVYILSQPIYQVIVYVFGLSSYYPLTSGRGLSFWVWLGLVLMIFIIAKTPILDIVFSKLSKKEVTLLKEAKMSEKKKEDTLLTIFVYSVVFLGFIPSSDVFPRFFFSFIFSFTILMPNIADRSKTKTFKMILLSLCVIIFSFYFYFSSIHGNGLDIWPYKFLF